MPEGLLHGSAFQVSKCGMETEDSRNIRSSGLEAVRKKGGNFLCVGNASRASAQERFHFAGKLTSDQKTTDSLWASESFVTGKCKCIDF